MTELQDSVAVVTGGAGSIGRATALALARAGAHVVVSDVDVEGGRQAAHEVERAGRRSLFVEADVGRRDEVEALVLRAIEWQGRCDVFVSNAGIATWGPPHAYSVEDWQAVIDVNLYASIWAMRAVLPHMLDRASGHLVFVSSGAGLDGGPDNAPYVVSKFGIVGLAESLARYLKGSGVGVTVVLPGAIGGQRRDGGMVTRYAAMPADELERRRAEMSRLAAVWPRPAPLADEIVEGIRSGRFWVFQPADGEHADWGPKLLRALADDPERFVLGD